MGFFSKLKKVLDVTTALMPAADKVVSTKGTKGKIGAALEIVNAILSDYDISTKSPGGAFAPAETVQALAVSADDHEARMVALEKELAALKKKVK